MSLANVTLPSPPLTCGNCGHSPTRTDIEVPPSPAPHLLEGNRYAEGAQIRTIRAAIDVFSATISELDVEIWCLKSALTQLQRKRDNFESYMVAHQGLLSPLRWVPSEILAEIFMYFRAGWGRDAKSTTKTGPLAITGVCRRWRDIALETPPLWSAIPIALLIAKATVMESMMTTWLMRAKSRPLSISIRHDSRNGRVRDNEWGQRKHMFNMLLASSVRWRHLHLETPLHPLFAPIKNALPNLQHLSLSGKSGENTLDTFSNVPQLSSLTYNVQHRYIDQHALSFLQPFQWKQLRRIDCQILWIEQDIQMLSLLPNIRIARLNVASGFALTGQAAIAPRRVHMPNLGCLKIICYGDPSALLGALCTPALIGFEMDVIVRDSYGGSASDGARISQCVPALQSFLSQSTGICSIAIHFDMSSISIGSSLISLLKATPKLEKLHLSQCDGSALTPDFLDAFLVSDADATFLPALASIHLIENNGLLTNRVNMLAFIDALRSRVSHGLLHVILSRITPLKIAPSNRGSVSSFCLDDTAVIANLRQLRDQGLDIRVLVEGRDILNCSVLAGEADSNSGGCSCTLL